MTVNIREMVVVKVEGEEQKRKIIKTKGNLKKGENIKRLDVERKKN